MKYPKSMWKFQKPHPSIAIHLTQKHIDFSRYSIRIYSNENDKALDITCGSDSIPLSPKLENRRFIVFDNNLWGKKNSNIFRRWDEIAQERIVIIMKMFQ